MNKNGKILLITFTRADWQDTLTIFFEQFGYVLKILCLTEMENISRKNIISYVDKIDTKCVVLYLEFSSILDQNFLTLMKRELNLKYIFYLCDDNTQKINNQKFMPICDLALVTSLKSLRFYNNNGVNSALAFHEVTLKKGEKYDMPQYDGGGLKIVFYGSVAKGRKKFLLELKEKGANIKILPFIKDQMTLRQEISKYDVVINFSKSHKRNSNRFFNTLLYKHFLKHIIKHPEKGTHSTEFKGRITECMMFKRLCFSEYFDEYNDFFPNNEMPIFRTSEDLLKLINDLSSKKAYYESLSKFLSILDRDSNSIHSKFLHDFEGEIRRVYDLDKGVQGKLNIDFFASLYSFMDKFIVRSYFVLIKYFKFFKKT